MITLSYPWLLLLVFVPLLLNRVLPEYREGQQAIRVPWFERTAQLLKLTPAEGATIVKSNMIQAIVYYLCWILVITALARPQLLESPVVRTLPTRDMLLLVDLSGSMETKDFTNTQGQTVDRLTAVKEVLDDFLTRREGDRVGLVVFGNAAFVQVPFTQDLEASRILLNQTAVRMAGPKTALGDAIGLGITLFERSDVEEKVIIALTDGNDTASKIPPSEAATIAVDNDILIHVIGVGDPTASGEEKLDEEALKLVAAKTGGLYYHASDRDQLENIYRELDQVGTRELDVETYRPRIDLFYWPLGAFLLLSLAYSFAHLANQLFANRKSEDD